jgi:hypothetical protein
VLRDEVLDEVVAEENAQRAARQSRVAQSAPAAPPRSTVGVRGITGSLTAYEVEQAMNSQRTQLLACVEQRPRALGHVAGDIAFHVEVDGSGKVERVRVMQSDIGYATLEQCLTAVVAGAPFPAPAGAQRAEAQWRMSVDPLREAAAPLDSEQAEKTLEQESEASYETCEVPKARRFAVNGYITHGKLQAVSVRSPWRGKGQRDDEASEQLTCLTQALEAWSHWPKLPGHVKVGFELQWMKAPPPRRARARTARRR